MTDNGPLNASYIQTVPSEGRDIDSNNDSEKTIAALDAGPTPTPKPVDEPPDGGYGWVCVACCFWINAHTWGINSVSGCPSICQEGVCTDNPSIVLWSLSSALPGCGDLPWRNLSRIRLRRRSLHFSSSPNISSRNLYHPRLWHSNYSAFRRLLRDRFPYWGIICQSDLAAFLEPRDMLRMGHGIFVCRICWCSAAVVYEE